ncbi:MAG TPA: nitroreductase family protein [Alphaproteobacteria bacterium]|nr:nitroreductase family protein [Alphaproteobacteria bacterium]
MTTSIRDRIRDSLPPGLFYMLRGLMQTKDLVINYIYDSLRYARWSPLGGRPKTAGQLAATITMDYHRVEKGLSLPKPRPGFGADVVRRLAYNIPRYAALPGVNMLPLHASYGALKQWLAYSNGAGGTQAEEDAKGALEFLQKKLVGKEGTGGAIVLKKSDIQKHLPTDYNAFFESRYSVRNFTDEKVSVDIIREAVATARKTPSVCNRQSWRVRAFLEPDSCRDVLALQNGNRGFGDQVGGVLLITVDLQSFLSANERYQGWIDGGMFSMSLALALHAQGLGTCCLNWSAAAETDRKLRKLINLPDNELVIMMMAVGHMQDEFKVATSPRIGVDDILVSIH